MANQKAKITKGVAAEAEITGKEYVVWDTAIQGFGLRVRPSGAKSYVFVYRSPGGRAGKVRRVTIKASTPDNARAMAKVLAAQHHGGGDPAKVKAEGRKKGTTVADVLDRFLTDHVGDPEKIKPKTAL